MGLLQPKAADLPIALEKGGSRRRGGGGGGARPALVLLAGAALVMMALQLKPPNRSLLDQLNVAHSADVAAWALGSESGLQNHARSMWQGDTAAPALGEQFLSFQVCGDAAHQRLAVLSGIVLAAEVNRTAVLPRLLMGSRAVQFEDIFDADHFAAAMRGQGVRVVAQVPEGARTVRFNLKQQWDALGSIRGAGIGVQHVSVSCPSFHLPAELYVKHEQLVFAAAAAMQLQQPLLDDLLRVQEHLQSMSSSRLYNVLHLHAEKQWVEQCARWERTESGRRLDNCLNNTATVGDSLQVHKVDPQVPLLLVTGQGSINEELANDALASLQSHGYKLVVWGDVPGIRGSKALPTAESAALIQYYLALGAHQFAGNSVALADALLIMERWNAGRFATYYNGGNIPLEGSIPLFPMPWVFTYNDWSAGTEYDMMAKAAVMSAIQVARMKAFCMFVGSSSSPMFRWLQDQGVNMIQHEPEWKDALIRESTTGERSHDAKTLTPLYNNNGSILATFLRIDIPKLPHFDQYNYVLFTDCDVYFRKHMKLIDWGTPLPHALGMGYERNNMFPYNAGVMMLNMPFMKRTNDEFIDWILRQHNGLDYGPYTFLDQGALNQFYEDEIKGKPISRKFNAMIYLPFREDARIVHMHGPKPNHYLQWLQTGYCAHRDFCTFGIYSGGFCKYMSEYRQFVPEWNVVRRAHRLCTDLAAGTWHPTSKRKPNKPN
ncbi:Glycosyl transferase family 8 [Chlorella sorokiniana]|uniref:Glycosyl transferase family 8 n=1 Tax=Chlorella sorokiniana TaxID=3076 RepID=A0A2P6U533_CHLSO|nr:Glycosyl transferase family 8 [Chlorella sorokiniana]|eukprot:PRW61424.1 Glycosyl transferase family 8 [Chlorella sorokiniana]